MWAWVGGLVIVSAGIRYALARRIVAPWIMVDELVYSELAKSFADAGRFLLRGEHTAAYGLVYPAILSPAWALFDRVPQAYAAAKAINAVVVSLAAIPAYLLARRVCSRPFAFAAAVLAMSVPTLLFAGMLMTENAFYPAFLLAALAMVLWLERPDLRRTLFLVGHIRARVPDPGAGGGDPAGDGDRAFSRLRTAGASGVPLVLRGRGRGRAARRGRAGRPRRLDLRRVRRLRGRGSRRVHRRRRLPLVAVPLGGADPVARGRAVRGARRPRADAARPAPRRAGVPGSRRHPLVLARARGRDVRLRAVAAGGGAQHVLCRPAVPDRDDALGRTGCARGRAPSPGRSRQARLRSSPRCRTRS